MPGGRTTKRRQPVNAQVALRQQFEAILAICTDPGLEGVWIDRVGRDEPVYIDAALARRKAGLPPLEGRRMISADWPVEPDWDTLERARSVDC